MSEVDDGYRPSNWDQPPRRHGDGLKDWILEQLHILAHQVLWVISPLFILLVVPVMVVNLVKKWRIMVEFREFKFQGILEHIDSFALAGRAGNTQQSFDYKLSASLTNNIARLLINN